MKPKKQNPFLLKNFKSVNSGQIAQLEALGLKNTAQMLSAGKTPAMRSQLASRAQIPETVVLELVMLSDLSRLPGVKGIRARLYYNAGVNCVEKLASYEPQELLRLTAEYVEQSGFEGIAPLPKEVSSTIYNARQLPKLVEW